MVVGQVGVIVLGFADTVMVGHYDTASLAAASFVNNVFNLAIVALLGFSYGITPLIGALFARGEYEKAGREFRHALIANVSFGMFVLFDDSCFCRFCGMVQCDAAVRG